MEFMNADPVPLVETTPFSASLLPATLQRLASQSAACKLLSIVLAAVALLFAQGGLWVNRCFGRLHQPCSWLLPTRAMLLEADASWTFPLEPGLAFLRRK